MKNITFLLLFIVALFNTECSAQQPIDTLNYVKQFEVTKANYIGQPFSKLLQDMTQIQPKTVWNRPSRNNKNIVSNTRFKFCKMDESFNNVVILDISWDSDIPYSSTKNLSVQNQYYFTNDEKAFYGSRIIKDIMVYR